MKRILKLGSLLLSLSTIALSSCSYYNEDGVYPSNSVVRQEHVRPPYNRETYESRMPSHISTSEKTVVVDPRVHSWGAYDSSGNLVKGGMASAGSNWCPDLHRACHTATGSFRVNSLGSPQCKSSLFPMPRGGAPMPHCMFFHKNQAIHGSHDAEVVDGNVSHGCVRLHVGEAEWLRYDFVNVGTKVIVRSY